MARASGKHPQNLSSPPKSRVLRMRHAWHAGVRPALAAVRAKLLKTMKKGLGDRDVRGFARHLLFYLYGNLILKRVLICCLAVY